jgi:hypothetical protein
MSTLATNKLGTLAGTADMSLPTTRPSQTLSGFLDSAGNLTFEDSPVKCEFLVIDGTTKVTKILVDVNTQAKSLSPVSSALYDDQNLDNVLGIEVGTWNLPEAVKSAYFQNGNVRWWDLQANGSAQGETGNLQYGKFNVQILDDSKAPVLSGTTATQGIAHSAWTVYGSASNQIQQAGSNTYWYNTADGSNSGNFGYGQYWLANSGGNYVIAPWFLNIKLIPWMNGYWKIGGRYASFGDVSNLSYGPRQSWGYTQPQMNSFVRAPASGNYTDRAYMGSYPAGLAITTGSSNASNDGASYSFANFTLTATIKPTTVVVA